MRSVEKLNELRGSNLLGNKRGLHLLYLFSLNNAVVNPSLMRFCQSSRTERNTPVFKQINIATINTKYAEGVTFSFKQISSNRAYLIVLNVTSLIVTRNLF